MEISTSLSVNTDGPRDAASSKIDHIMVQAECNHQTASVGQRHIATQTDSCRLLAHICTVRLKFHLVDMLSTYYTNKFATNPQQIELMEIGASALVYNITAYSALEAPRLCNYTSLYYITLLASTTGRANNRRTPLVAWLTSLNITLW